MAHSISPEFNPSNRLPLDERRTVARKLINETLAAESTGQVEGTSYQLEYSSSNNGRVLKLNYNYFDQSITPPVEVEESVSMNSTRGTFSHKRVEYGSGKTITAVHFGSDTRAVEDQIKELIKKAYQSQS